MLMMHTNFKGCIMKKAIILGALLTTTLPIQAAWQIQDEGSHVNFVTEKIFTNDKSVKETQLIKGVVGTVDNQKQAEIKIDFSTIDTKIPIRNQRIKEWVLDTTQFRYGTVKADLSAIDDQKINVGESSQMTVKGDFTIRDKTLPVTLYIKLTKESATEYSVSSYEPTVINTSEFDSNGGVQKMTQVMGLKSINNVIPVSWQLKLTESK